MARRNFRPANKRKSVKCALVRTRSQAGREWRVIAISRDIAKRFDVDFWLVKWDSESHYMNANANSAALWLNAKKIKIQEAKGLLEEFKEAEQAFK